MSKKIEVHRHYNLVEMSQEDPEVKAWLGESYKPIGPYFDGKVTGTGLDFKEQRMLLPEFIGVEASDKDFRRKVTETYDNFIIKIPKDGISLEVGLEDDSKPLSETNLPLQLPDYLKYRFIIRHPDVAQNKEEAQRSYSKKFYIVDPNQVTAQALSVNTLEDKAYELYMRFKDDSVKVDQILTMLGRNVSNLKKDKILVFKQYASKNPKLDTVQQSEAFKKFIDICEDKDLEMKFLIEEGIAIQYLKRVGANILYNETSQQIGVNMEDTVLYFKNPKNSRELNLLKAQYQTKAKKGNEYLPKDEQEVQAKTKKVVQETE